MPKGVGVQKKPRHRELNQLFIWARMDDIIVVNIRIEKMIFHMSESFIVLF